MYACYVWGRTLRRTAYRALDKRPEEMKIEVVVGVPKPAAVHSSPQPAASASSTFS